MRELRTRPVTADSRIGSHNAVSPIMMTSQGQLALRTSSMKARVFVSTHCADTASTPIVPMRSPLAVTARPLVGEGLTLRCTRMPRRGSYFEINAQAGAGSGGAAGRGRGGRGKGRL